jgi:CRISPR system Cascade subunit CasB
MTAPTQEIQPFIAYLQSLAEKQERGALAALRRGLGQPPGTVAETFRYVEPWLGERRSATREAAFYLLASLFALHPMSTNQGNMGAHLAQTRPEGGEDALERRFTALLAAHIEDLPYYLRQAVSFLKSKEVPINWNELLWDLQNWDERRDDPRRSVQKKWASAFWGRPSEAAPVNANEGAA